MLICEQGGMNEVMAELYALTGDTDYLELAREFCHKAVLDPLAQDRDILDGLHSNMQIPKVIGAARLYELTGVTQEEECAKFFWDRVDIRLPMKLHTEALPGTTNILAVLYGPIVLAGELGTNGLPDSVYAKNQTRYLHWPTPTVPAFVCPSGSLLEHIKATDRPLTFRTEKLGRPKDVTLVPLYQIHKQRYSVYWDVYTETGWKTHQAEESAELEPQQALEARTVDLFK